jgi:hypothetical protein
MFAGGAVMKSITFGVHREWHRPNYLYSSAELTRPCLFDTSFISNHATQQQVETSARGKPT